jgi:hypothetical protein
MKRRRTKRVASKWKLIETILDPSKHRNLKLCFEPDKDRTKPANGISVRIVGCDPEQLLTIIDTRGLEGFLDQKKPLDLDRFDFDSLTLNNVMDDAEEPILMIENTRKFRNLFHPSIFPQVLDILQQFADTKLTPLQQPQLSGFTQLSFSL